MRQTKRCLVVLQARAQKKRAGDRRCKCRVQQQQQEAASRMRKEAERRRTNRDGREGSKSTRGHHLGVAPRPLIALHRLNSCLGLAHSFELQIDPALLHGDDAM